MTNSLYELVQMPEYLARLRAEAQTVRDACGDDNDADLDQMQLAQCVFNETLRLHPGAPMSARTTVRPAQLGDYTIPAGSNIFVFNFGIQRHPDYWPDADVFSPQRWEQGQGSKHPFAFVPFGGGAHKCVGMHFSMMEYKSLLLKLLTGYNITLATETVSDINLLPMPHPRDGLQLHITPI